MFGYTQKKTGKITCEKCISCVRKQNSSEDYREYECARTCRYVGRKNDLWKGAPMWCPLKYTL